MSNKEKAAASAEKSVLEPSLTLKVGDGEITVYSDCVMFDPEPQNGDVAALMIKREDWQAVVNIINRFWDNIKPNEPQG